MPNVRRPGMRKHKTGVWFVRWGGRDHYLGMDQGEARVKYAENLQRWAEWQAAAIARRPRAGPVRMVSDLLTEWLDAILVDAGEKAKTYYTAHSGRFRDVAGRMPISAVSADMLMKLKATMVQAGYAARTVNHDLKAAKRFLQWCEDAGHCAPVKLRTVKMMRPGASEPKAVPMDEARKWVARVGGADARLRPWLALALLTGCRPVEVGRLVRGEGEWWRPDLGEHGRCVFKMANKAAKATGTFRYVVLSPEALAWLRVAKPHWGTASGYWQAVEAAGGAGGSHFLRHSAWTFLRSTGLPLTDVQLMLGHAVPGAWRHYEVTPWHVYQRKVARLTLGQVLMPPFEPGPFWVPPAGFVDLSAGGA